MKPMKAAKEFVFHTMVMRITGTSGLIVNSERSVNTFDPLVREKKALTRKRNKTDDDLSQITRIEWELAMYHDPELGPFIPAQNIEGSWRDGAKLIKRSKDIERGLQVTEAKVKLQYSGPRDIQKMWDSGRFSDIRSVVQQRSRIMKCRPIFFDWSAQFTTAYDPSIFNPADILQIVALAGRYCGIGDYRRRFGRYTVEELEQERKAA